MIFAQIGWPSALNERQNLNDLSVAEGVPIAGHRGGRLSVTRRDAKFCDIKQKLVRMVPSVARLIMRGSPSATIRCGMAPVHLTFKIAPMTRGAICLVECGAALDRRLVIRKKPNCAGCDGGAQGRMLSPKQDQHADGDPYSGQVSNSYPTHPLIGLIFGKSNICGGTFYPQRLAP